MEFADEVQTYCKTNEDVTGMITAAESYLKKAGVAKAEEDTLYALAVKMLVAYWVDHHITASGENRVPQSYDFAGVLLQLQFSQEDTT